MSPVGADQTLSGSFMFHLSLGGAETAGYFKEFDGLGSENEVIEHRSTDPSGKTVIQKIPGQLKWNNLTLKRGVDTSKVLWEWRQMVVSGGIATARKDGTITLIDSMGAPVSVYKFIRGWPCKYSSPGVSADSNEILLEEIEITHEGFERVS
ncbi:MAG: phage tail protein [Solirubrobacteraceae bacterium]